MGGGGIFLEGWAKAVLLLHALSAIVLAGSSTHLAVVAAGVLRGGPARTGLARLYAKVVTVSYAAAYGFGLLAYPSFRYNGRAMNLDRHAPWASNLFDMKENFASLGLPLVAALLLLTLAIDPEKDRAMRPGWALAVFGTAAIVWFNVVAGILVGLAAGGM